MCGRTDCINRSRSFILKVFITGLVIAWFSDNCYASPFSCNDTLSKDEIISLVLEKLNEYADENNGDRLDELESYFRLLIDNPLSINIATKEELQKLSFLSDFQIESIVSYRQEHGPIWSLSELSLLNGFDIETGNLLKYFVSFSNDYALTKYGGVSQNIYFKGNRTIKREDWYKPISKEEYEQHPNSRYVGSPYYLMLKYQLNCNRLYSGFVVEKDAGELITAKRPADFFSGYVMYKNIGMLNRKLLADIIVGDYTVRFGQGLSVWNTLNMNIVQNAIGFNRRGDKISPYNSSNEINYLRGAAVKLTLCDNFEFVFFGSFKGIDANLKWCDDISDYKYSSIQKTGLHNTESLLQQRRAMKEIAFGTNVSFKTYKLPLKMGLNWVTQSYTKQWGKTIREDNKYQVYNGYCGSFSIDYYTTIGKVGLWGEFALDYNSALSCISGLRLPLFKKVDFGILIWDYSKKYIAPLAGSYNSGTTGPNNQMGIAANLLYYISNKWKVSFNNNIVHYPWKRYNIPEASSTYNFRARVDYTTDIYSIWANFSERYNTYGNSNCLRVKMSGQYNGFKNVKIRFQNEYSFVVSGVGLYVAGDIVYNACKGNLKIYAQTVFYKCNEWEQKLYLYENDLPLSFTSALLYGEGFKWYLMVSYKLRGIANLYLKIDKKIKFGIKVSI